MSTTTLDTATAAHADAKAKLEQAQTALGDQEDVARKAVAEQRRLEQVVMNGDASVAQELGQARLEAETEAASIDAFTKGVARAKLAEQQARLKYVAESLKAGAGDLLSDQQVAELGAEAREAVHAVLFPYADAIQRHNDALAQTRRDVEEAQKGLPPNTGVMVNAQGLWIDGGKFSEHGPQFVIENAADHVGSKWHEDRNAEAIAKAKAEVEAKREEANRLQAADRGMMNRLDGNVKSRHVVNLNGGGVKLDPQR